MVKAWRDCPASKTPPSADRSMRRMKDINQQAVCRAYLPARRRRGRESLEIQVGPRSPFTWEMPRVRRKCRDPVEGATESLIVRVTVRHGCFLDGRRPHRARHVDLPRNRPWHRQCRFHLNSLGQAAENRPTQGPARRPTRGDGHAGAAPDVDCLDHPPDGADLLGVRASHFGPRSHPHRRRALPPGQGDSKEKRPVSRSVPRRRWRRSWRKSWCSTLSSRWIR